MDDYYVYLHALTGGALIGLAASGMLFANGRIMGVSGILGGLLSPQRGNIGWRISFVLGIFCSSFFISQLDSLNFQPLTTRSNLLIMLGGLLVGFGTALSNGCTSGHGVCGISRFSMRSVIATCVFIGSGVIITYLLNHVLLGAL